MSRTGKRWRTSLCSVPMLLAQFSREHLKIEEVGVHRAVASWKFAQPYRAGAYLAFQRPLDFKAAKHIQRIGGSHGGRVHAARA